MIEDKSGFQGGEVSRGASTSSSPPVSSKESIISLLKREGRRMNVKEIRFRTGFKLSPHSISQFLHHDERVRITKQRDPYTQRLDCFYEVVE